MGVGVRARVVVRHAVGGRGVRGERDGVSSRVARVEDVWGGDEGASVVYLSSDDVDASRRRARGELDGGDVARVGRRRQSRLVLFVAHQVI